MITFQNPRDTAWFPVIVLPAGWWLLYWCNYIEVVAGYGVDDCLLKIDRVPEDLA